MSELQGSKRPVGADAAKEYSERTERLLRAVFNGALDAILLANDEGRYVDANPAACELFGLSLQDLVGRRVAIFAALGPNGGAAYRAFRNRGQLRGRFPLERADGTKRVVDYSAVADVLPGLHLSVLRDVTDQVATEEALRHKEAQFRALIEKSAEAISLTKADGSTEYITPLAAARLLGFTVEEMAGRTPRDQVIPEDRLRITAALERLVESKERDLTIEFRVQHRDGSLRWIESSGTNLLDDPDVGAIVGNYRDITARKQAEEALDVTRQSLEEAQAIAHVGSWTSGLEPGSRIHWSRECYRIFGVPEQTHMTVESFMAAVHPLDRERVTRMSQAAAANDAPYDVEHRVVRPDGRPCWVHERAVAERDSDGRATRLIGTVQDITARHASVEALTASEERYRRIVENTSEGVWMYDAQSITTFMNGRLAEMLGYTVQEVVGQSVFMFMDASERAAAEARVQRRREGRNERGDFRLRRKDGTQLWASVQANSLLASDGRFEAALVLVTDISAQRLADEARARLAAIVESSEDAIIGVALDGTITSFNSSAEKLHQYSSAEMVGQSIFSLVPPTILEEERRILERAAGGEAVRQHDTKRCRRDGTIVEISLTVSSVRDVTGSVIGVAKIERDLTAQRQNQAALERSEDQFRHAQKMEAVGRLAGGVAHDFNNRLSVILSYAELAMAGLKPIDPLRDDLAEICTAAKRAAELTQQLLAFSRRQILKPRVVDLDEVITGMKSMLARLLGEDVELVTVAADDVGRVLADPGQIEQVVMNLAVNARDAMPEGGKLTIETSNVELDAAYANNHRGVVSGSYVRLAVTDTGVGMDAATRSRIFEPFFTTKAQGKGTGLGLSTVFGIVEQSGGHVDVSSEPEKGSIFEIYLPRSTRAAERPQSLRPASLLQGAETILLVEDEAQVRTVASAILRRNGYHVLETSSGGEALIIAKQFDAEIHLLLTDVVMPHMSGSKLAEELSATRPKMRVLFTSGYTDDHIVHLGVLDDGVAFLEKPFTPDKLLRKISEVLRSEE